MQVIDLLFRQELNLRLHVIGDLARPIRWVHASDSRDPAPYLNGEEVVLSTGAWFNGKESVTRFVAGLMKANVAALGFGVHDDMPTVPMELIVEAKKNNLTLFEVPSGVTFISLSELFVELSMAHHEQPLRENALRNAQLLGILQHQSGADYTHGTTFRRASEEGLLDPEGCMHIGIRGSLYAAKDLTDDKALGFQILSSIEFQDLGAHEAIKKMQARVGQRPVYISIDIDVLDPAHAPGTGTPEAGGLTSRELLSVLRATAGMNVIGADVVEVAPAYDHAQITGIAASHVIYELISAFATK